jgi:hypothetical protein
MSESKESGSVRGLRNAYVVTAVAVSCLLVGTSSGLLIRAGTPGIPTVIEPGSSVTGQYYTIFADGSNIYVKNGTTGTIDYATNSPGDAVNWAIAGTPPARTIAVLGDLNFTTPIQVNSNINLVVDGNVTAYHTDFLIVGDETHFVTGANIWLNSVSGFPRWGDALWPNSSAIRMRNSISVNIYFSDLMLFDKGIYFDPVGLGSGENSFFGGRVLACNYGISWNMSDTVQWGIWSQGNRFYLSLYACNIYGFYASGGSACDMQTFIGTVDMSAYNVAPGSPLWVGGGKDIWDDKGGQKLYLVFCGTNQTTHSLNYWIGPGTLLMTQYGEIFPELTYTHTASLTVGTNSVLGPPSTMYPVFSIPRQTTITLGGSFGQDEQITVEIYAEITPGGGDPQYGSPLWLNFTATGSTNLTVPQSYSLVPNGCGMFQLFAFACSNQTSTSVTVSVAAYV